MSWGSGDPAGVHGREDLEYMGEMLPPRESPALGYVQAWA